jgi:very long chain acyl-CoA dehydrogenase
LIHIKRYFFSSSFRCLSTQAKAKVANDEKPPKTREAAAPNYSFVNNIFRGKVESSQIFPYPMYLNQEQLDTMGAFVDPISKYFTESHDAARLDLEEKIDEQTIENMKEFGAFGVN